MHAPPDAKNRNAGLGWHPRPGVGKNGLAGRTDNPLHSQFADADKVVISAVPANERWWRIKTVSPGGGAVVLPQLFVSRYEALGAAVMVAHRCGAVVMP